VYEIDELVNLTLLRNTYPKLNIDIIELLSPTTSNAKIGENRMFLTGKYCSNDVLAFIVPFDAIKQYGSNLGKSRPSLETNLEYLRVVLRFSKINV